MLLCMHVTGAACVVFSSHGSYIAAVSARFMQLNYGSLDKKVLKISFMHFICWFKHLIG